MRTTVPFVILALVAGAAGLFVWNGSRNAQFAAKILVTADDLYLFDLDGQYVGLSQLIGDGVVVAIFTRSDCPISNRYAPAVGMLCERFDPQGVSFYLIYVDPRETADAVRAHLAEYSYPCSALRDPEHTLASATGATVTPEAVVFDVDQNIVYRGRIDDLYADLGKWRTEASTHDLADAIEATLAGRPVAEPVTKAVGCYIEDLATP